MSTTLPLRIEGGRRQRRCMGVIMMARAITTLLRCRLREPRLLLPKPHAMRMRASLAILKPGHGACPVCCRAANLPRRIIRHIMSRITPSTILTLERQLSRSFCPYTGPEP